MKKAEPTVRAVLLNGKMYQRRSDGSLVPLKDRTDLARLDAMTEEEIERIAANDPDGPPMTDEEWARAKVVQPAKVPVGIKLDADILQWFKSKGRGYQTRINTVLRRYMDAQRKAG